MFLVNPHRFYIGRGQGFFQIVTVIFIGIISNGFVATGVTVPKLSSRDYTDMLRTLGPIVGS